MMPKEPVIETSDTLAGDETFTSHTEPVHKIGDYISYVVGTVHADQDGILEIQFDDGSENWDSKETRDYHAGKNLSFKIPIIAPYFRMAFTNGTTSQSTFRLNAWEMT